MAEKPFENQDLEQLVILKGAVENANEAFITIDEEHRVLFFNRTAERMFGYRREEVVGRDLCVILSPEHHQSHPQAIRRYLQELESRFIGKETELTATRRSGEQFPAMISFSVAEIQGRLFFTAIIRDMTETRRLQRQVGQAERLALLGQVVAEISHEIKNPLIMIGGWARRLTKSVPDEQARRRLQDISEEVQRLEHLLAELRNLYVPRKLVAEEINLRDLLTEVYRMVRADCEEKSIAIELQAAESYIMGDREKLLQVFLNVVKNSMEALSGMNGHLAIAAKIERTRVEITVTDNGPGIPAELREKIFQPFFTTKRQGTGLGLCVTKRIIEDHPGSSLVLKSAEGVGTAVTISFPLHKTAENP